MHLLYIDESGDLGAMPVAPLPNGNDQPVLIIGGLIVPAQNLEKLTQEFLYLKGQFFPGLAYPTPNHLDKILAEIKGTDIKNNAVRGKKRIKRHAIGFLDKFFDILDANRAKLIARVWVKGLGLPFDGRAVYTSSIQWMYHSFDSFLSASNDLGFTIADSRDHLKNVNVAHSIFTQKFSAAAPSFGRVLELPTFGHSDNHAGIQICDIICSAVLNPIAAYAYCTGYVGNVHVQPGAFDLRQRFGPRLQSLQYRYQDQFGKWRGGVTVSDAIGQKDATHIFK